MNDLQRQRKQRRRFERHQLMTTIGGFAFLVFVNIILGLLMLAASVWVVVWVLKAMGVLN